MQRLARPVLEEFEPRILYSADLAALLGGIAGAQSVGPADMLLMPLDQGMTVQPAVQAGVQASTTTAPAINEIVFVDLAIPDAQTLISGLQAQRDAGRPIEIVTIHPGADGLQVISDTLAQRDSLGAVHLIGHGESGVAQLGTARLDMATLLARAGEVAAWSSALGADADLLIYGCDVGAGAEGRALLAALAALSGADVAASDDTTAAAARGGDWLLEQQTGSIEAAPVVNAALQQAWAGQLGDDIAVNTSTVNAQHTDALNRGSQRAVAYDAAGNFVVVWTSSGQDLSGDGVYARRFSVDGSPLTGEIRVNSTVAEDQRHASVVADSTGNFVVVWSSDQQDGNNTGVYLRRFAADGNALTGEIRANVATAGKQENPAIAMNPSDGSFAVAWQGQAAGDGGGIYFRRFAADGSVLDASDQRGNLSDVGNEQNPALAVDGSGRIVIAYDVNNHVYFQRFDAAGTAQGTRVQIDTGLSNSEHVAVAADAAGNFTFVYHIDSTFEGIWGRAFLADGSPRSLWFNVDSGTTDSASIAMAGDGRFIVTYQKSGSDLDILAREFGTTGSPAAASFVVNQHTAGDQRWASAALLDMDHYVVVWSGASSVDLQGVSARVFQPANVAPVIVSHGGGNAGAASLDEGAGRTLVVSATDANLPVQALSYSIAGGADAARFVIDAGSGVLRFVAAPDYEAADDAGADHRYDLVVQVSDGLLVDTQMLTITINNVDEPPSAVGGVVSGTQDNARVFAWSDFGVSDIDSSVGANTALRIETLPADGRLQVFNGSAWADAARLQIVSKARIDMAGLRFMPDSGEAGNDSFATPGVGNGRQDYAQFSFRPVQTTPISVVNAGAQSDALAEGVFANTAVGWARAGTSGGAANAAASTFALDHDNSLYVDAGSTLSQSLASSFVTGLDLNLGFDAGWRGDSGYAAAPGFNVELWAGSTPLGQIDQTGVVALRGAFVSGVLAVDGAAFAAANGQALSIRFSGLGSQAHIDNLVLTSYQPAKSLGAAATMNIDIASAQTAPVIGSNGGVASATLLLAENTSAVTTVLASDADLPLQTLSYSLVAGGDAALFVIHPASGALSFITAPDRELPLDTDGDSQYVVTVRASDGSLFDTQTLTIVVFDVNEYSVGAISDSDASANGVAENAGVGTLVGIDLAALDADASNNAVTFALSDNQGGRFVIDASSGVVRLAAAVDFEAASAHTIVATATSSDGSVSTVSFTVNVLDTNEAGVGVVADTDPAANSLAETAAVGSTVGISALASDPDLADTISYSLTDSAGGRFVIRSDTGLVTLAAVLDAEAANSHTIVVRADSSDGSFNTQSFTIAVQDINESPVSALTDADVGVNSIAEGAAAGSLVGVTARAVDTDVSNSTVRYTLDNSAGGRFAIDALSGVVSLARGISEEGFGAHLITVSAMSADTSFSSADFNITIVLANDHAPLISSNGGGATATLAIDEGDVLVTQIVASDADLPASTLRYSISGGADAALFVVDVNSGLLRFITAPDAEAPADAGAANAYLVNVVVSDGSRVDTQALTVHVRDLNEFAVGSIDDSDVAANAIGENASPGATTGVTAFALDADVSNSSPAYTLADSAGGRFAIDAQSGVIRLARGIAEEGFNAHLVTVRVTSADGSTATQDLAIAVTLSNDHAPVITSDGGADSAALTVDEGQAALTTVVSTVSATDADRPAPTLFYSLAGGADAALFTIDTAAGSLRFVQSPDYETPADANRDGIYAVTVSASDGLRSDSQALSILVRDIDEAPVWLGHTLTVSEGGSARPDVRIVDVDTTASRLRFVVEDLSGGRFERNDAPGVAITGFTQADLDAGLVTFVSDGGEAAPRYALVLADATTTLVARPASVRFTPVNDAPVLSSLSLGAIDEDGSLVLDAARLVSTASDAEGQALQAAGLRVPAGGASVVDLGAGRWRIDAAADWNGTLTLVYDVSDGVAATPAQATLDVRPVNDAPVFINHGGAAVVAVTVDENRAAVATLVAGDAESPTALRFAIDSGADAALFRIDTLTGALVFVDAPDHEQARDADANGRYELIVSVSDGSATAQQLWLVAVGNVDEAPMVTRHALLISEQGVTLVLQSSDPDSAAATLFYEVGNSSGGGFELRDQPGQVVQVFSQADVTAGRVIFVADAGVQTPSYTLVLSDGLHRVDAGAPQWLRSAVAAPAVIVAPAAEAAPTVPSAPSQVSADPPSADASRAATNDLAATGAVEVTPPITEATLPLYDPALRPASTASTQGANMAAAAVAGLRGAGSGAGAAATYWGAAQIVLALPGDEAAAAVQRIAFDYFGADGSRATFAQALDEVRRQMNEETAPAQLSLATTALVSSGLSVGYVLWLARGGVLVASLMSSVPAWASIDPLPVLAQMRRTEDGAGDDAGDNDADRDANESDPLERLFSRARRLLAPATKPEPSA